MVESSNNQQINTFIGGMNLDFHNSILPPTSYREAYNLRITTDTNSNSGTLHNIEGVKFDMNFVLPPKDGIAWTILGTSTIRNYGVIVAKTYTTAGDNDSGKVGIFRFVHTEEALSRAPVLVFCNATNGGVNLRKNISIVSRYEDEDNIKIYIADGENPIRTFNIAPSNDKFNQSLTDDSSASVYPSVTFGRPSFSGFGKGNLYSGVIQYGYQLFNKNGSETEVSPLTDLIYLNGGPLTIDSSIKCEGSPKGESTGKSVKLHINLVNSEAYTRIKLVSLFYDTIKELPLIQVLKNIKIPAGGDVYFEDSSNKGVATMSVEEFNMVTNVHFAPKILESKNNYLFASDIKYLDDSGDSEYDARAYRFFASKPGSNKDNASGNAAVLYTSGTSAAETFDQTSVVKGLVKVDNTHDCINPYNNTSTPIHRFFNKYFNELTQADAPRFDLYRCNSFFDGSHSIYGGIGVNVKYRFIVGDLAESTGIVTPLIFGMPKSNDNDSVESKAKPFKGMYVSNVTVDGKFVNSRFIKVTDSSTNGTLNYSNPLISYYFKSLQRDEIYRYGVVLYDKFGQASSVKWIGDIRTPSMADLGFETFLNNAYVGFTDNANDRFIAELSVRPLGIEFELSNLPSDIVSYEIVRCERTASDRSVLAQGVIGKMIYSTLDKNPINYRNLIMPPALLHMSRNYVYMANSDTVDSRAYMNSYFMFVSPETSYTKESMQDLLKGATLKIEPKKALFSAFDTEHARIMSVRNAITSRTNRNAGTIYNLESGYWRAYFDDAINSRNVIKLYHQSNGIVPARESSSNPGAEESVLNTYNVDDFKIPKDLKWSEHRNRFDHAESFDGKNFLNWSKDIDFGNGGPNGRCVILAASGLNDPTRSLGSVGSYAKQTVNSIMSNLMYQQINSSVDTNTATCTRAGVFLCNLFRATIPYGGDDYGSRQFSNYITNGAYKVKSSTNRLDAFNGDTFIGIFDYCKNHWATDVAESGNNDSLCYPISTFYYIPVESSINLALTHGPEYHKDKSIYVQTEPSNVDNKYTQETPLYTYNPVYSTQSTGKTFVQANEFDELNKTIDTRTYHSEPKTNDESIDSWTKFKPINYLDVDTRYGKITNLRTFGNELMFWQEHALGKFSVLERTMITDESNSPLLLGTGGVLSRFDYVATTNGMKAGHNDCDTYSDTVLYWYDQHRQEICAYSNNSVDQISKSKHVHSYVRRLSVENADLQDRPFLEYDKFYNEVLCCLSKKDTLVFNEKEQVFSGFITIVPDFTLIFGRESYMLKNNSLYRYNSNTINVDFDGKALPIEFKYVVNKDYMRTKVFDNVEFTGLFVKEHINRISFNTETMDGSDIQHTSITDRELNYRFAVPRMKSNATFKNRLRGRYLECKFVYDLIGQSTMHLVSHVDEYLNTYDDKYMVTNKPQGSSNRVERQLKYYATDVNKAETFEIPYIRTTFRASLS